MASRTLHAGFYALLAVALLVGAIAPAIGAPPPRPLCDACGESFERTAESHGIELTVERSTATVTVHENGSATWVVRNRLADSEEVERLRSNASLRTRIADRAMWDTEFIGASASEDGVLTMRYLEPEFARQSVGGTLRSGEFTRGYGYRNLDGLGAERLVVVAPEGMEVGWTASGGTLSEDGQQMTLTQLEAGGFVTFVPRNAALGPLWSLLAVASVVAPVFLTNAFVGVILPTATFGLLIGIGGILLGTGAGALSRVSPFVERTRDPPRDVLAVGGGLIAVALLVGGGLSLLGGGVAPLFGVGVTLACFAVALSRSAVRRRVNYRTLVVGAAVGTLIAAGATVATAVVFDQNGLTRSLFSSLPFLAPVFALLPAGYALGRVNRRLAIGTAAAGFALVMALQTSVTTPAVGFGFVPGLIAVVYALGIAIVGAPLLVVGALLAAEET